MLHEEQLNAMIDHVEEKLYCAKRGAEIDLIIKPGGVNSGIEYGPIAIKVVSLDEGKEVAYRFESDEYDGQWHVGNAEDVAEYWLTRKEVIDAS